MSVSTLGLFFIVVFITCITPGAGVLYTLKNAINYGKANAFLSPTGNAIGVLFMSTLAASGLGAVIHESPVMFLRAADMRMHAVVLVRLEKLDGSGHLTFFFHQVV